MFFLDSTIKMFCSGLIRARVCSSFNREKGSTSGESQELFKIMPCFRFVKKRHLHHARLAAMPTQIEFLFFCLTLAFSAVSMVGWYYNG